MGEKAGTCGAGRSLSHPPHSKAGIIERPRAGFTDAVEHPLGMAGEGGTEALHDGGFVAIVAEISTQAGAVAAAGLRPGRLPTLAGHGWVQAGGGTQLMRDCSR